MLIDAKEDEHISKGIAQMDIGDFTIINGESVSQDVHENNSNVNEEKHCCEEIDKHKSTSEKEYCTQSSPSEEPKKLFECGRNCCDLNTQCCDNLKGSVRLPVVGESGSNCISNSSQATIVKDGELMTSNCGCKSQHANTIRNRQGNLAPSINPSNMSSHSHASSHGMFDGNHEPGMYHVPGGAETNMMGMGFAAPYGTMPPNQTACSVSASSPAGYHVHHGKTGGCTKWKRWSRVTDNGKESGYEMMHDSEACDKNPTDGGVGDQPEQLDGSDEEVEPTLTGFNAEFGPPIPEPQMTHFMNMEIHHLRLAKNHRMLAQQFAKRNRSAMKQQLRSMRKCGMPREQIKAVKHRMKAWRKQQKSECDENISDDKEETSSEEENSMN